MKPRCQVVCRCRKVLTAFRAWVNHLKERHPRLYQEWKADGTLMEDQAVFRKSRESA